MLPSLLLLLWRGPHTDAGLLLGLPVVWAAKGLDQEECQPGLGLAGRALKQLALLLVANAVQAAAEVEVALEKGPRKFR